MPVETTDENRSIGRVPINKLSSRQRSVGPAFMVPITASDPTTRGQLLTEPANTIGKLLGRIGIAQVDAGKLKTAAV